MISIVDDDTSVRESTMALVRSLGYNARAFASAEEFLDANLDDTSCLILDVQMKGLSGIELQERLIGEGRRTPSVSTCLLRVISRLRCAGLGCHA